VTRFGIILPSGGRNGPALGAQSLADAARRIEAAGFESVWAFDAIGRGFLLADPLTALSVAATVTRHVELGTGVLQVPLRNPVELAQRVLTTHGLLCSMSRKGHCYDNAVVESFFHTLKTELVGFEDYHTHDQARVSLFEYMEVFYNRLRRHSTLNYRSPAEFETVNLSPNRLSEMSG